VGQSSIRQAGITLVVFTIAVKIIGLVKEMVLAANFGTSQIVDIYLAGITVPSILNTIITWALPDAFVPLFSAERNTRRSTSSAAYALIAMMAAISVSLWIMAKPLASLTGSGFSADARAATIVIAKIAAFSVFASTIEALFHSRLLAQKRFAYAGMGGIWISVAMIAAIVAYPAGGARTLAWGYVAGVILAAVWNLWPYIFPRRSALSEGSCGIHRQPYKSAGRWVVIVFLLSCTGQLYILLDRYLASFLAEGSIAVLNFAALVASQPVAIYGLAIGIAVQPFLPEKVIENDLHASRQIVERAMRWVLIGSVPSAVLMGILGDEIVSLLFERGVFDASSRSSTGVLLLPYAVWLLPAMVNTVLTRVSYAMFRWRPILIAEMIGLIIKASLSIILVGSLGAFGLVTATAIAAMSSMVTLIIGTPGLITKRNWVTWGQLLAVLFALSAAGTVLAYYLPVVLSLTSWRETAVMRIAAAVLLNLVLLTGLGPRLRIAEFVKLQSWLANRVRRR